MHGIGQTIMWHPWWRRLCGRSSAARSRRQTNKQTNKWTSPLHKAACGVSLLMNSLVLGGHFDFFDGIMTSITTRFLLWVKPESAACGTYSASASYCAMTWVLTSCNGLCLPLSWPLSLLRRQPFTLSDAKWVWAYSSALMSSGWPIGS